MNTLQLKIANIDYRENFHTIYPVMEQTLKRKQPKKRK